MAQELGETVDEMIKDDDQAVQDILNKRPTGHYWIVIHHKPIHKRLKTGQHVIAKVIKDYDVKPNPLLGTVILEVLNGSIVSHEINMHDMPIDWVTVSHMVGYEICPHVQKRPDIARAYVYNGGRS